MALMLVNFGGPRDLNEIVPFLEELLCDRDVVWTNYPSFFHRWLFRRIAQKRGKRIAADYKQIGGRSPIYFDTEEIGRRLLEIRGEKVLCFHRYLPATHDPILEDIEAIEEEKITVLPLFPQFTYATTGSIARFFQKRLSAKSVKKLAWIGSYCDHPAFIACWQEKIEAFLRQNRIENPVLLFTAHGIPLSFVQKGDPYQRQCERTFQSIMRRFPGDIGRLCYQSKFGPGEWLRPYTNEACEEILQWSEGRKNVVFIPMIFTSDHIETLYEIEELYLPLVRARGVRAYRCPAFNQDENWIQVLQKISENQNLITNGSLVRRRILKNRVVSLLP